MTPGSSRTGKPCQRLAVTLLKVAVTWKLHNRRWPETAFEETTGDFLELDF